MENRIYDYIVLSEDNFQLPNKENHSSCMLLSYIQYIMN